MGTMCRNLVNVLYVVSGCVVTAVVSQTPPLASVL